MNKKYLVMAATVAAAATLLAGCGSSADKQGGAADEQKTLVVGMEPTFPPFEFTDNGKYVGFDIDLANAIGEKTGMQVEVKSLGFDALIPALRSGQIDRLKIPPKEQDREFDELYAEFDEAFLKLYPSFVEEFNELLRPEARYETTEGRLNTELRIFALMRLGLTNVNQIAEFLRCSLQTVYNYKSKIKSKAQPGIEHFEEEVRKLGQNTFASDSM